MKFLHPRSNLYPGNERKTAFYPFTDEYPFEPEAEQIVRALEERNWSVPGITVEFADHGSGEDVLRYARIIRGQDFKLKFNSVGRPGGAFKVGVWEVTIPGKELNVWPGCSPTLSIYVGNDWERDRDLFEGRAHAGQLNQQGWTYLVYKSSYSSNELRENRPGMGRHEYLVRDDIPAGGEPQFFRTREVLENIRRYLEYVVLRGITSLPIPAEKIDCCAPPESIPFPASIGPLFCFVREDDVERIRQGKADASKLAPAARYGIAKGASTMLSHNTPNDGTVPKIASSGFIVCRIGEPTESDREFAGIARVTPDRANSVYVVDHSLYEKRREELYATATKSGRDRLTEAEVADYHRARARTIIPITEYAGGFEEPWVLVNRELGFGEVETIHEPPKREGL